MTIYSIISARSGSKGVPKKNIKLLGGYPLIAYSIIASKLYSEIRRTIVSTDSQEIADIALSYGAEVPFLRPVEISQDDSTDLEMLQHVIKWLDEKEGSVPDLMIHLRPTTPFRVPSEINRAIKYIQGIPHSTSLRSVHELAEPPQKQVRFGKDDFLEGFFPDDPRPEYFNLPRQLFPKAYRPNGHVDIIKPDFIIKNNSHFGANTIGFLTPVTMEVDLPEDFEYLEYLLNKHSSPIYEYLVEHFPRKD